MWGDRLSKRFCKFILRVPLALLGQHGICSTDSTASATPRKNFTKPFTQPAAPCCRYCKMKDDDLEAPDPPGRGRARSGCCLKTWVLRLAEIKQCSQLTGFGGDKKTFSPAPRLFFHQHSNFLLPESVGYRSLSPQYSAPTDDAPMHVAMRIFLKKFFERRRRRRVRLRDDFEFERAKSGGDRIEGVKESGDRLIQEAGILRQPRNWPPRPRKPATTASTLFHISEIHSM